MPKCNPHIWRMPRIGDLTLDCEACDRKMDFMSEMTPNFRASIMNGYERRRGPGPADEFREAFNAAFDGAHKAWMAANGHPKTPEESPQQWRERITRRNKMRQSLQVLVHAPRHLGKMPQVTVVPAPRSLGKLPGATEVPGFQRGVQPASELDMDAFADDVMAADVFENRKQAFAVKWSAFKRRTSLEGKEIADLS